MDESRSTLLPPSLDYEIPQPRHNYPVLGTLAALSGILAGLFGALMLFYGIDGVIWVLTRKNNARYFAEDSFAVMLFVLIGAVCAFVAVRWCRAAGRLFTGS